MEETRKVLFRDDDDDGHHTLNDHKTVERKENCKRLSIIAFNNTLLLFDHHE